MLKYTFSSREKFLMALLAFILLGMLWYRVIFTGVQDQLSAIESQQLAAEDTITLDTVRLQRKAEMEAALAQFDAADITVRELPEYDNAAPVMSQLYTVLATRAGKYDLSFDELTWADENIVGRGATLSFGCSSYTEAKAILVAIYDGDYPCQVDNLAIKDNTTSTVSTTENPVTVTAHITYFEEVTENSPTKGLPPVEESE